MMTKEQMADMLAALIAERDEVVAQANQRIAYLNGKIELLREMTAPAETAPAETPPAEAEGAEG